ncbi:hypothetical protein PYW07_001133 [Mythimna separata]|uniref:Uncharacterized protein n=1 Tax=Mythimna separata TaxID=271217 RepID=A0AAD7YTZ4_MYTSE|nr:hypothetical protein PYW07_001133 [Mythimna separata]
MPGKSESARTVTRRSSSLITHNELDHETYSTTQGHVLSSGAFPMDSMVSIPMRTKGCVRTELITMMFDSMLDCIVESWDTILPPDHRTSLEFGKTLSDITVTSKKKKNVQQRRLSKATRRSRSRIGDLENDLVHSWWSCPDERAVIRFRNGNMYEGNISSKCMHGEGRFQWADGTVYLGNFVNNEINGKGIIQWKNDTWYEGEFAGNLRHGKGLYVDSRAQRSYSGGWHLGTKHGEGAINYTENFKNSYDGQWIYNERYGYGSREYCELSGYKGDWDKNERHGKGLMIWPNHDFYRGGWQNGVMSGYGIYIWEACYNNTMALPSINAYRVARRLYAKKELPGTKPDTIVASAFRKFMDCDVLPGCSHQRGHLVNGYGKRVPLKATYELYRALGEPHTVRTFLCAVRRPPHCLDHPQPGLVEVPDICVPIGRNAYIFGDELSFFVDDDELPQPFKIYGDIANLKLFNFGNLSSKTIIKIFHKIFPNLCQGDKIMDLDIELSFLEFFEAFVTCAEESIRVRDEELKWRNKFSIINNDIVVPPSTPAGHGARSK